MQSVFRTFIERLLKSVDIADLHNALAHVSNAFDLRCFAYLSIPQGKNTEADLISTYPAEWTSLYLANHYERLDPVIQNALRDREPFEWGPGIGPGQRSLAQHRLLEEAAEFGIRYGFTIPIHDDSNQFAAVTFAADERSPPFRRCVENKAQLLQLLSILFHTQARSVIRGDRVIAGARLTPRQLECLQWAARGKSATDIGCILDISPRTVVFHIENAKARLGVRTIAQAVALLASSKQFIS